MSIKKRLSPEISKRMKIFESECNYVNLLIQFTRKTIVKIYTEIGISLLDTEVTDGLKPLTQRSTSPQANMMMSQPPHGVVTDSDGLILPKKLMNPCLESKDRKDLHRELMFNNKV